MLPRIILTGRWSWSGMTKKYQPSQPGQRPATANRANCGGRNNFTVRGSYTGSASPYGTFDQGGNAEELIETSGSLVLRRGGFFNSSASDLAASSRSFGSRTFDFLYGFRVAMVPEPGTGVLLILGLAGLSLARRHSI